MSGLLERAAQAGCLSGLLSDFNISKVSFLHPSELVAPKRYRSTIRFSIVNHHSCRRARQAS
jgi:hypothetical protein